MNASRSTRLEPLQMVAGQREEEAMRTLAECRRRVEEQEARLLELQRYLQEYTAHISQVSTPALFSNRQAFLAKLQEAEAVQIQMVEQAQAHSEAERTRWMLKRQDVRVLEKLAASYRVVEKRHEERRDQKNLDELANQQRHDRRSHHDTPHPTR